jgi:hypothetical protein
MRQGPCELKAADLDCNTVGRKGVERKGCNSAIMRDFLVQLDAFFAHELIAIF